MVGCFVSDDNADCGGDGLWTIGISVYRYIVPFRGVEMKEDVLIHAPS